MGENLAELVIGDPPDEARPRAERGDAGGGIGGRAAADLAAGIWP
jgi:hypothetical protein